MIAWIINRLKPIILFISTAVIITGCGSEVSKPEPEKIFAYSGPRVLVIAEDQLIAEDAAYLITGCLGYTAIHKVWDNSENENLMNAEYYDLLVICPKEANGWIEPGGETEYKYLDDMKSNGKAVVIFGVTDVPGGCVIYRDGKRIMPPSDLSNKLKPVYAVALAADDGPMLDMLDAIKDKADDSNLIELCRTYGHSINELAFAPYDGELPDASFGSDRPIDEILAECPDPFGARPLYVDLSENWNMATSDGKAHWRSVKIPEDWGGATILMHPPLSDSWIFVNAFNNQILYALEPNLPLKLAVSSGGEEPELSLVGQFSKSKKKPGTPGLNSEFDFAPARIEATIPNPPTYRIYWDKETEQLMVDCNFPGNGLPYNKTHVESLTGGTMYCTVYHPDGETVRLKALIPSKSPRNRIIFPLTKHIPWHLEDPLLYKFRFLFETDAGVDEYIATFGHNRVTSPDGFFRFEDSSAFLRGAYDDKLYMSGERDSAFFGKLKADGFNCYIVDNPFSPRELYAASEAGVLTAYIGKKKRLGLLSQTVYGEAVPSSYIQSPSWMGMAKIEEELSVSQSLSGLNFLQKLKFNAGDAGREWEIMPFPQHTIMMYPDGADFSGLESVFMERDILTGKMDADEFPECIAYYTTLDAEGSPSGFSMYEFINIARRQDWCAGFVIPLEAYDRDEHLPLMTDDFLIIDLDGFPLDVPLKARRGSTLKIPLRYVNLKAKGDMGGAVFWKWEKVKLEGRVNYDEIGFKGVTSFAALDVIVPDVPGEYRLRFEVLDYGGFVQAFNHLDVVVE